MPESMALHERLRDGLTSAEADVIDAFEENFAFLESKPVVLYGIGEKTGAIVEHCKAHNIVGLMDKMSTGCVVYGKRVLSDHEAIGACAAIIIVANYASVGLIYRRNANLERQHGSDIYHLNGTKPGNLHAENLTGPEPAVTGVTYADLQRQIELHDVISFDLFDTLLLRKCLSPGDIFQIVERRLDEEHGVPAGFARLRIEAERAAYRKCGNGYTIDDIYREIASSGAPCDPGLAGKIEIEVELSYLAARKTVVEAMRYAKRLGKFVAITSDTYLPSEVVVKMLGANGIVDYDLLTLSCEVKRSKFAGDLWQYYKETFGEKRVLHVGDDELADIGQAERCGIDTVRVPAASELSGVSVLGPLKEKARTLDDRLLFGSVISTLFNDPFLLSRSSRLYIDDFRQAGYAFWGPLVMEFMQWLIALASERGLSKILFLSRDGYLLERLYRRFVEKSGREGLPEAIYFLASRRALSVSSIQDHDGIRDVFRLAPYVARIDVDQFLRATFGITAHRNDPHLGTRLYGLSPDALLKHVVAEYADEILGAARVEWRGYLEYFASLGIDRSEKIGIINFVSSGVTQHFFEKLFDCPRGLFVYFATRVDFDNIPTRCRAKALYGSGLSPYSAKAGFLIKHYLTAESVFSSPEEQFVKFSEGLPVFESSQEGRDFSGIAECHEGIQSFFDEMTGRDRHLLTRRFSPDLADAIFGGFFSTEGIDVSQDIKDSLYLRDAFAPDAIVQTVTE